MLVLTRREGESMLFQINKKYYIYIGIMIGFLIASIDTSVIAKENEKKGVSLEDKAIELAKQAVISVTEGEDWTVQNFIKYNAVQLTGEGFLYIGWRVIDVSESIYAVTFNFITKDEHRFKLFHVIPKDDIAQYVHIINAKIDLDEYMRNIKTISTYSDEKVSDNLVKLFAPILDKKKQGDK